MTAKADGAYHSTIGGMACKAAISALEKIRQYQVLGTVEELKEVTKKQSAKQSIIVKAGNEKIG